MQLNTDGLDHMYAEAVFVSTALWPDYLHVWGPMLEYIHTGNMLFPIIQYQVV